MQERTRPGDSPDPGSAAAMLQRLLSGAVCTQAVYVLAKLGIPDLLVDGPKTSAQLALAAGAHGPSLYRLLRFLATVGVVSHEEDGRFASTPMSMLLTREAVNSLRATALFRGEPWVWATWGSLLHSVQTGQPAFEHVHGMGIWEYTDRHPEAAAVFNQSRPEARFPALVAAYDFTGIRTLVDVGAGTGQLLSTVLPRYPEMRGVLFDLPKVVSDSAPVLDAAGVADRCQLVGGNFFETVPAGGDVYILSGIVHDWGDEEAAAIMRRCSEVMTPESRLLVLELIMPPGPAPQGLALLDLMMLAMTSAGARQRTEAEFRDLFTASGFVLARIVPTVAGASVLEGHLS